MKQYPYYLSVVLIINGMLMTRLLIGITCNVGDWSTNGPAIVLVAEL